MPIAFDGKQGDFSGCVAHFMSKENKRTGKNFTKEEASKVCGSLQAKQESKAEMKAELNKLCFESNIEYKAIEIDGKKEHHISGFVSVPSVDNVDDLVPESLQPKIVDRINKGFANRVSHNHDFLLEGNLLPVASAKAELKSHPKVNKNSAWVDVILDEESPKFNDIISNIEGIKGFSIEYPKNPPSHFEIEEDKVIRVFDDAPIFGLALVTSPYKPVNPMATADGGYEYKAILDLKEKTETKMEHEMEKCPECDKEMPKDKMKEHTEKELKGEKKMEEKTEVKAEIDFAALGKKVHEEQEQAKKIAEMKAIALEAFKAELKAVQDKEPYLNPVQKFMDSHKTPIDAELKAYRDVVNDPKASSEAKFMAAGKLHQALEPHGINNRSSMASGSRSWKKVEIGTGPALQNFSIKAFEYKAELEHDTNKVSDTDYYQNAAELNDVYDAVILDHLNQKTTYYGLLRKVDASNIGSDRHGFRVRTGRIAGAGGDTSTYNYDENQTLTGQASTKIKVQAPFMQYGAVVEVSGFMEAMSRGSIGSAFAKEVMLATADLLKGINVDLLGTAVGFTAGGKVTGLQVFGDDGSNYANLYGHARATYTTLQGNLRAQTGSPNITKILLRQIVRDCEIDGADKNNLIFVCNPIQRDKILGMLDPAQRFNNASARAGFEGLPTFDGVPIHSEVDATNTVVHVVPMDKTYLSVLQAPTFEDLAKTIDSKKGLIKTYFAHIMEQPNHGGIITGLSNS